MSQENVIDSPLKTVDIANSLGIAESTIRKYCNALEAGGYSFNKDGDTRLFTAEDLQVIGQLKNLRDKTKISVEHAVSVIMTKRNPMTQTVADENAELATISETVQQHATQTVALQEMMKNQGALIQNLINVIADRDAEHESRIQKNHLDLLDELAKQNELNKELSHEQQKQLILELQKQKQEAEQRQQELMEQLKLQKETEEKRQAELIAEMEKQYAQIAVDNKKLLYENADLKEKVEKLINILQEDKEDKPKSFFKKLFG